MAKPILTLDSISYEVFLKKFEAWCFEKDFQSNEKRLQVIPSCLDDALLHPLIDKLSDHRTTLKSFLEALKEEFDRQTRPSNPEAEFLAVKTLVSSEALKNHSKLQKMATYLNLGDDAVKQRLFNSCAKIVQQSLVVWMDQNPQASSRELANFLLKFPASEDFSHEVTAAAKSSSSVVCEHCKTVGHSKSSCFKLRSCWRCGQVGHISKFCKNQKNF